ncbi:hypothetical protein [Methanoregula sp. UBA64]|jgi:hypothetical protein|uniref:hypothetical protein n=1 Tax=Methanoregula sp. UBA64 TaxID=1915554 RepID=UPI0025EB540F|nr:hypothetical protein [Methanoregula sp. UBA64]
MTRGRRPTKALTEAVGIACRRGSVENVAGRRGRAFDFIIIEPFRVVFVKVKRSRTSFTFPQDALAKYGREIACLHRVALTRVTAREFWVRSPAGEWQHFLIRHDSVIEVHADGTYIPREVLPLEAGSPAESTADGE